MFKQNLFTLLYSFLNGEALGGPHLAEALTNAYKRALFHFTIQRENSRSQCRSTISQAS